MVWFIDPQAGTIEPKLHFAYTPSDQDNDADGPDNITVSPYGRRSQSGGHSRSSGDGHPAAVMVTSPR